MRRLEKVAKNTYRTSWTTWTDKTKDIRHTTIGQTILDPLSPIGQFPPTNQISHWDTSNTRSPT